MADLRWVRAMTIPALPPRGKRRLSWWIEGGEHGSVSRDELHEATGVHAGAARWRALAFKGFAVPADDRGSDDAGGGPHAVAGVLPARFAPLGAQRARAGGDPVRKFLHPLCRATARATAA